MLKFKFVVWYNGWLLRYSTFHILRSSSIGGHLHFIVCKIWFGLLSISLKLMYGPISGYWDILLLIFWGLLLFEVVFLLRICKIWFSHLYLGFKFENDPLGDCQDIPLVIFWGRLILEVIFILRIYKLWFGHLSTSCVWSNKWLLRYGILIFWGLLPLEVSLILMICKIWFGHLSLSLIFEHGPISGCSYIPLSIF